MCKCGCNDAVSVPLGPQGPVGPQGPAGECNCTNGLVQFKSLEEIVPDGTINFMSNPVASAGDYVIMFEGNARTDGQLGSFLDILSKLKINSTLQTSNTNYLHTYNLSVSSDNLVTITHNAKVTLTSGQTVGFEITTGNTFIDNCSITLFKF